MDKITGWDEILSPKAADVSPMMKRSQTSSDCNPEDFEDPNVFIEDSGAEENYDDYGTIEIQE